MNRTQVAGKLNAITNKVAQSEEVAYEKEKNFKCFIMPRIGCF